MSEETDNIEKRLQRLNADSIIIKDSLYILQGPWNNSFTSVTILGVILLAEKLLE